MAKSPLRVLVAACLNAYGAVSDLKAKKQSRNSRPPDYMSATSLKPVSAHDEVELPDASDRERDRASSVRPKAAQELRASLTDLSNYFTKRS